MRQFLVASLAALGLPIFLGLALVPAMSETLTPGRGAVQHAQPAGGYSGPVTLAVLPPGDVAPAAVPAGQNRTSDHTITAENCRMLTGAISVQAKAGLLCQTGMVCQTPNARGILQSVCLSDAPRAAQD